MSFAPLPSTCVSFRSALKGSTALTPVTWLYMQAAANADRAQAAADQTPLVPLADRIDGIVDDLSRQIAAEA